MSPVPEKQNYVTQFNYVCPLYTDSFFKQILFDTMQNPFLQFWAFDIY
jgi:hypothetical protein